MGTPIVQTSALACAPVPASILLAPGAVTLDALVPSFLRWLALVRERGENTVRAYTADLNSFCGFAAKAGLTDPRMIRVRHLELYLAWIRRERLVTPVTANRHLHCLRTFWTYLIREEICANNPAAAVFLLKAGRRLPSYLTLEEQEQVLGALALDATPLGRRTLALVAVMLFCGLRVSEAVNLTLKDVDLTASILRVRHGKGDKDRELPIVPRLRGILRAYLSDGRPRLAEGPIGCVYTRPDRRTWSLRYTQRGVRVDRTTGFRTRAGAERARGASAPARPSVPWFFVAAPGGSQHATHRAADPLLTRTVFKVIRLTVSPIVGKPVHPHVLRHSFASRLREAGAPLELIQEALGHATIATTLIYSHLSTGKRRADLTKFLGAMPKGGA